MPSESPGGCGHLFGESRTTERRHRKFAFAWRFKDIAALINLSADVPSLAGNTDCVFHLVVIGFEFAVLERPVLNGRALRNASGSIAPYSFASYFEVPRTQAPALPPVVNRCAAHRVHHRMRALDCHRRGICPERGPFAIGFLRSGRPYVSV